MTANGKGVSFGGNENILQLVVMAVQLAKNHWIVHFKRANFMVCELYLNKAVRKPQNAQSLHP